MIYYIIGDDMTQKKKNIVYLSLSLLTAFSCFFNQWSLYMEKFNPYQSFTIDTTLLGLNMLFFFFLYKKCDTHRLGPLKIFFALFLSGCMLFGQSFHLTNSLDMLFSTSLLSFITLFRFLGYFVLFYMLLLGVDDLLQTKIRKCKVTSKFLLYFDSHPVKASFITLICCWSIYMIAFYPVILSRDPSYQILQYFNIPTKYLTYVVPLSSKVHLTNHHPVLHTLLLGGMIQFGRLFGSDNLGLFMYSLLQTFLLMSALVATIVVLKKENVSVQVRGIILAIYSLVPMFPFYAMSAVKDTIYTVFMIFYCLFIYYITKKEVTLKTKHWILFFICMMLLALFRNNGVYVILLSLPLIFLYEKRYRKIVGVLLIAFVLSYFSYDKVLLPSFKITAGSKREVLSIPFQQTARLVKEHPEAISKKNQKVIDQVLEYKTLGKRYQPEISDPVKNKYNPKTTTQDLTSYFHVWWNYLWKYPKVYIEATLNNVYGYFYPGHSRWYLYSKYFPLVMEEGVVDYHYNHLEFLRMILVGYGNAFPHIPGIGLISNIGFNTWVLLLLCVYSLHKKQLSFFLCLTPLLISLLICIASPVNAYFRYAMPYIFIMPWCVAIFLKKEHASA